MQTLGIPVHSVWKYYYYYHRYLKTNDIYQRKHDFIETLTIIYVIVLLDLDQNAEHRNK